MAGPLRSRWCRVVALVVLGTIPVEPVAAQDDDAAPLESELRLDRGRVRARFEVTSAFTEEFRRQVSGGLTRRVRVDVFLLDVREQIVFRQTRTCEFRRDVWDDVVYARIRDTTQVLNRRYSVRDAALAECGRADVDLGPEGEITPGRPYRVRVVVVLNPVSEEMLERTREFTSNPRGTTPTRARTFFGAVARLFSSESEVRGTVFSFRSDLLRIGGGNSR